MELRLAVRLGVVEVMQLGEDVRVVEMVVVDVLGLLVLEEVVLEEEDVAAVVDAEEVVEVVVEEEVLKKFISIPVDEELG
jgi:hypothetical protein